jgi:hypothetical protein
MGKNLSLVCRFSADERRAERRGWRTDGKNLNPIDQLKRSQERRLVGTRLQLSGDLCLQPSSQSRDAAAENDSVDIRREHEHPDGGSDSPGEVGA